MVDSWSRPISVEEIYGDWDYEAAVTLLEQSLNPRRGAAIFDTVESLGIGPDDTILDIGGRDGTHALTMAERFGCKVVSVDPVKANIDSGLEIVAGHEYGDHVELVQGAIERIPADDNALSLVFSRDMFGHVKDAVTGLAECARVLVPGGAMLVHGVYATDLMEPVEALRLYAEIANVPERMDADGFETIATQAGFSIESLDLVGSEWYEATQEAGTAPNYALQLSRLRRAKKELLEELGEFAYRAMYANALWSIYLLIGKLETRVYVLRNDKS